MGSKTMKKNRIAHKNKATAAISNLIIESNYVEITAGHKDDLISALVFVGSVERRNQNKFVLFGSYSENQSTNDASEMWKIKV